MQFKIKSFQYSCAILTKYLRSGLGARPIGNDLTMRKKLRYFHAFFLSDLSTNKHMMSIKQEFAL